MNFKDAAQLLRNAQTIKHLLLMHQLIVATEQWEHHSPLFRLAGHLVQISGATDVNVIDELQQRDAFREITDFLISPSAADINVKLEAADTLGVFACSGPTMQEIIVPKFSQYSKRVYDGIALTMPVVDQVNVVRNLIIPKLLVRVYAETVDPPVKLQIARLFSNLIQSNIRNYFALCGISMFALLIRGFAHHEPALQELLMTTLTYVALPFRYMPFGELEVFAEELRRGVDDKLSRFARKLIYDTLVKIAELDDMSTDEAPKRTLYNVGILPAVLHYLRALTQQLNPLPSYDAAIPEFDLSLSRLSEEAQEMFGSYNDSMHFIIQILDACPENQQALRLVGSSDPSAVYANQQQQDMRFNMHDFLFFAETRASCLRLLRLLITQDVRQHHRDLKSLIATLLSAPKAMILMKRDMVTMLRGCLRELRESKRVFAEESGVSALSAMLWTLEGFFTRESQQAIEEVGLPLVGAVISTMIDFLTNNPEAIADALAEDMFGDVAHAVQGTAALESDFAVDHIIDLFVRVIALDTESLPKILGAVTDDFSVLEFAKASALAGEESEGSLPALPRRPGVTRDVVFPGAALPLFVDVSKACRLPVRVKLLRELLDIARPSFRSQVALARADLSTRLISLYPEVLLTPLDASQTAAEALATMASSSDVGDEHSLVLSLLRLVFPLNVTTSATRALLRVLFSHDHGDVFYRSALAAAPLPDLPSVAAPSAPFCEAIRLLQEAAVRSRGPKFIRFDSRTRGGNSLLAMPAGGRTWPGQSGYCVSFWLRVVSYGGAQMAPPGQAGMRSHGTIDLLTVSDDGERTALAIQLDCATQVLSVTFPGGLSVDFAEIKLRPNVWYHVLITQARPGSTAAASLKSAGAVAFGSLANVVGGASSANAASSSLLASSANQHAVASSSAPLLASSSSLAAAAAHHPVTLFIDGVPIAATAQPSASNALFPRIVSDNGSFLFGSTFAKSNSSASKTAVWDLGPAFIFSEWMDARHALLLYNLGPAYGGSLRGTVSSQLPLEIIDSTNISEARAHSNSADPASLLHVLLAPSLRMDAHASGALISVHPRNVLLGPTGVMPTDDQALVFDTQCSQLVGVSSFSPERLAHTFRGVIVPSVGMSLSDALACVDGLPALLRLIETSDDTPTLLGYLQLLVHTIKYSWRNTVDMDRIHGYDILAHILSAKKELLSVDILTALLYLVGKTPDNRTDAVISNIHAYSKLILNFSIWKDTTIAIQRALMNHFVLFIDTSVREFRFNLTRIAKAGGQSIMERLVNILIEEAFADDVLAEVIRRIGYFLRDDISMLDIAFVAHYVITSVVATELDGGNLLHVDSIVSPTPSSVSAHSRASASQTLGPAPSLGLVHSLSLPSVTTAGGADSNTARRLSLALAEGETLIALLPRRVFRDVLGATFLSTMRQVRLRNWVLETLLSILTDSKVADRRISLAIRLQTLSSAVVTEVMLWPLMLLSHRLDSRTVVLGSRLIAQLCFLTPDISIPRLKAGIPTMRRYLAPRWHLAQLYPSLFALLLGVNIANVPPQLPVERAQLLACFLARPLQGVAVPEVLSVIIRMVQMGVQTIVGVKRVIPSSTVFGPQTIQEAAQVAQPEGLFISATDYPSVQEARAYQLEEFEIADGVRLLGGVLDFLLHLMVHVEEFKNHFLYRHEGALLDELMTALAPLLSLQAPQAPLFFAESSTSCNRAWLQFANVPPGGSTSSTEFSQLSSSLLSVPSVTNLADSYSPYSIPPLFSGSSPPAVHSLSELPARTVAVSPLFSTALNLLMHIASDSIVSPHRPLSALTVLLDCSASFADRSLQIMILDALTCAMRVGIQTGRVSPDNRPLLKHIVSYAHFVVERVFATEQYENGGLLVATLLAELVSRVGSDPSAKSSTTSTLMRIFRSAPTVDPSLKALVAEFNRLVLWLLARAMGPGSSPEAADELFASLQTSSFLCALLHPLNNDVGFLKTLLYFIFKQTTTSPKPSENATSLLVIVFENRKTEIESLFRIQARRSAQSNSSQATSGASTNEALLLEAIRMTIATNRADAASITALFSARRAEVDVLMSEVLLRAADDTAAAAAESRQHTDTERPRRRAVILRAVAMLANSTDDERTRGGLRALPFYITDSVLASRRRRARLANLHIADAEKRWRVLNDHLVSERSVAAAPVPRHMRRWMLDNREGVDRLRRRLVEDTEFYLRYPYVDADSANLTNTSGQDYDDVIGGGGDRNRIPQSFFSYEFAYLSRGLQPPAPFPPRYYKQNELQRIIIEARSTPSPEAQPEVEQVVTEEADAAEQVQDEPETPSSADALATGESSTDAIESSTGIEEKPPVPPALALSLNLPPMLERTSSVSTLDSLPQLHVETSSDALTPSIPVITRTPARDHAAAFARNPQLFRLSLGNLLEGGALSTPLRPNSVVEDISAATSDIESSESESEEEVPPVDPEDSNVLLADASIDILTPSRASETTDSLILPDQKERRTSSITQRKDRRSSNASVTMAPFPVSETPISAPQSPTAAHTQPPPTATASPNTGAVPATVIETSMGDKPDLFCNCARIVGLDVREGVFLMYKKYLQVMDDYFVLDDVSRTIVPLSFAPREQREYASSSVSETVDEEQLPREQRRQIQTILYSSVRRVQRRRYMLRSVGLELFLANGRTVLIALCGTVQDCTRALKILEAKIGRAAGSGLDMLRRMGPNQQARQMLLQRWQARQLSNLQYLMALNALAGRSFNDLTQYPVFPWVLKDYTSEELDLTNPNSFRNLAAPMGAQTPARLAEFVERFETLEDSAERFHYGTHYSSAMAVCTYLMRLEPFTHEFLKLQGDFDRPDRLFHSIADAWRSSSELTTADVKELTPEFYYMPEFLVNSNRFDLGLRHESMRRVDDVVLPPWAHGSPELFISQMRAALECDYVSDNLHKWIDLIFGYQQRGQAAIEAVNLFHPLSYDNVDLDSVTDPVQRATTLGIVTHFGQTPAQLFKEPHPSRNANRKYDPRAPIISLAHSPSLLVRSVWPLAQIAKGRSGREAREGSLRAVGSITFESHTTQRDDLVGVIGFVTPTQTPVPLARCQALLPDSGKMFLEWGAVDQSLRLYAPRRTELASSSSANSASMSNIASEGGAHASIAGDESVVLIGDTECIDVLDGAHVGQVTAVIGLGGPHMRFASGGEDATVRVWRIMHANPHMSSDVVVGNTALFLSATLSAHTGAITCLATNPSRTTLLSGSTDQTCVIWDLDRCSYVRTLGDHDAPIVAAAMSDATGYIATCTPTMLRVWTGNANEPLAKRIAHTIPAGRTPFSSLSVDIGDGITCVGIIEPTTAQPAGPDAFVTGHSSGHVIIWGLVWHAGRAALEARRTLTPGGGHPNFRDYPLLVSSLPPLASSSYQARPGAEAPLGGHAVTALLPVNAHGRIYIGDANGKMYSWSLPTADDRHRVRDHDACMECAIKFSVLERRRPSCRTCGGVFCASCLEGIDIIGIDPKTSKACKRCTAIISAAKLDANITSSSQ